MLNYQYALLEYGMLFRNFSDAVSEGDGQRIMRCWKFFLLFLKGDGQRSCKYALEGLNIMCQLYALLSPRDAHRLIWNRSVKAKGGMGRNIPLDLTLEHFNPVLKQLIKNMGPNALNEKDVNPISFPEPAILLSRNERLWDNPSHIASDWPLE